MQHSHSKTKLLLITYYFVRNKVCEMDKSLELFIF